MRTRGFLLRNMHARGKYGSLKSNFEKISRSICSGETEDGTKSPIEEYFEFRKTRPIKNGLFVRRNRYILHTFLWRSCKFKINVFFARSLLRNSADDHVPNKLFPLKQSSHHFSGTLRFASSYANERKSDKSRENRVGEKINYLAPLYLGKEGGGSFK